MDPDYILKPPAHEPTQAPYKSPARKWTKRENLSAFNALNMESISKRNSQTN